jgi:hypothetical protein
MEAQEQIFYYCQNVVNLLKWCTFSEERMGLSFTISAGPRQRSHSGVKSPAALMAIFCCLRFETSPTWRARFPYLYPPGTGWLSYTPRHRVPFLLPPTTRRVTVVVYEPAFTHGWLRETELLNDWRFTANQFVLGQSPLRLTAKIFFSIEHLWS